MFQVEKCYQSDPARKVSLVRWKDNKSVSCISNYDSLDKGTLTSHSRENIRKINLGQPKVITSYNKGIGGVDKMDQAVAVYRYVFCRENCGGPYLFTYLTLL